MRTERTHSARIDLLEAYVDTYLTQEIRAEALVRSLESFSRFLEVAALANGQVTDVTALARDSAVARPTVQGSFEVLTDTLSGGWLSAWRPRAKLKEVQHPKFYLFDCGVVRALAHRLREPLDAGERGQLLETLVFHELRAHIAYVGCGGSLSYYRTPSGTEVDFVWSRGNQHVGIEVKAGRQWRAEYGRAMRSLHAQKISTACHAVHLGDTAQRDGPIRVWPLQEFLARLTSGEILGRPGKK